MSRVRMSKRIGSRAAFLLAASALVRLASAQPAPAAPAAGADAWYRILIQGRHVGYSHLAHAAVREKDQDILRLVYESSFSDYERNHQAVSRVEADLLPPDFTVLRYRFSFEEKLPAGSRDLKVTCERTGEGKWTASHQSGTGTLVVDIASDLPVTIEEAIPLFLVRKARPAKAGDTVPCRILNPFHTDQPVLDIEVDVRRPETRSVMGKEGPAIPCVWRRRYLSPEDEITRTEFMTEAGEVVESTLLYVGSKTTVAASRAAGEGEARPAGKRIVQRMGRRDPFDRDKTMSRRASGPGGGRDRVVVPGPPGPKGGKLSAADILQLLKDARALLSEALAAQKAFADIAGPKIEKLYNSFLDIWFVLQGSPDLTEPQRRDLETMRGQFESINPGGKKILDQGRKALARAQQLFDEGDDAGVQRAVEDIKSLAERNELRGTEFAPLFQNEVLVPARRMEERIKIRQEFRKIKLEVTGIIYNLVDSPVPVDLGVRLLGQDLGVAASVRLPVSRSGAIVNGFAVEEGDVLNRKGEPDPETKPDDGLVVAKVRPDEVVFRYREENIPVPLR